MSAFLLKYCFNSTLVQLKGYLRICFHIEFLSFNSTLVQLKDLKSKTFRFHIFSFNSTLVQLKEADFV